MDGMPFAIHRRRPCIDAGVGAAHVHLLPDGVRDALRSEPLASAGGLDASLDAFGTGGVVTVCYSHDLPLSSVRRADLLRLQSPAGVRELLERGSQFAHAEYLPRLAARADAALARAAQGAAACQGLAAGSPLASMRPGS
mmetsp:Transcript_46223/g.106719  ORF Transcript_46223/g.106719 Transcript_46223/m.106719 type:complete len:140 (-) Transcript_46223:171-590(-)